MNPPSYRYHNLMTLDEADTLFDMQLTLIQEAKEAIITPEKVARELYIHNAELAPNGQVNVRRGSMDDSLLFKSMLFALSVMTPDQLNEIMEKLKNDTSN